MKRTPDPFLKTEAGQSPNLCTEAPPNQGLLGSHNEPRSSSQHGSQIRTNAQTSTQHISGAHFSRGDLQHGSEMPSTTLRIKTSKYPLGDNTRTFVEGMVPFR
jgi:hypothetical protein